ncbi:THAP domain-containing protein 7 isoform X2 [Denticeps clupeoides]|nr:THAP domain-containing protein 7 isoform X2 [Denticeps clupeoides]XP_028819492.1 THAP domain-containing protein 7 isoform X2 [Denticeps clupeoides]
MPRHCSAVGCNSRDTREARKSGITFHRLPKRGNPRRALWIINSHRKGPKGQGSWDPQSDYVYFCSRHFTAESFELPGVSGYRRVKEDAVPTIFETFSGRAGRKTQRRRSKATDEGARSRTKGSAARDVMDSEEIQIIVVAKQEKDSGDICKNSSKEAEPVGSSELPQSSLQDCQSAEEAGSGPSRSPPSPRPPSPSRYMRRLPPPPGFYLPKEHSYALLCPLVWRKRYDRAIDSLQKALRVLGTARRRENRLRLALLRLRESHLKSLVRMQEGGRSRDGRGGPGKVGVSQRGGGAARPGGPEDVEAEGTSEDLELSGEETRMWKSSVRPAARRAAGEEEEGCCFYCGRGGREDDGFRESGTRDRQRANSEDPGDKEDCKRGKRPSKRGRGQRSTEERADTATPANECFIYYSPVADGQDHTEVVSLEFLPAQVESGSEGPADFHDKRPLPLHTPAETDVTPQPAFASVAVQEAVAATYQLIQTSPALPQGVVLLPVVHGGERSSLTFTGLLEHADAQAIIVSGDQHAARQSNVRAAVVSRDVKERLKEHLEGFQLQLSNEFMD